MKSYLIQTFFAAGLLVVFSGAAFGAAESSEAAWNRLNVEVRDLRAAQQIEPALIKAQEALLLAEKRFGKNHFKTAQSLRDLSDLRFLKKDHLGADRDLDRARLIWEAQLGESHPFVLSVRRLRAERLAASEQWSDAIAEMEVIRRLTEAFFGAEHGAVATIYRRMGAWYWAAGQKSSAFEAFEKELGLLEKTEAADSARLKQAYHDLSDLYLKAGSVASAVEIRARAVRFMRKSLGIDHPDLADQWAALADLDATQSEGNQAEEGYLEAIRILEKNAATDPDTRGQIASIYHRLREWYASVGRTADALRVEQKAKEVGGDIPALDAASTR